MCLQELKEKKPWILGSVTVSVVTAALATDCKVEQCCDFSEMSLLQLGQWSIVKERVFASLHVTVTLPRI